MIAAHTATAQPFPVLPALPLLNADPPTGTHVYLLKNSRLGLPAQVPIWEPGFPVRNLQNALGLPASVRQTRVGSRCSGKERDVETGLDYFGARYLSSAQGRWTSPDWSAAPQPVPYAALDDPQSLNLYAYVRNNPLRTADVDGHQEPPPEEEDVERDRDEEPFGREEVKPETPEATQREVPANPAFEQWQNRLTPEQRQSMADRLSPSGCPVLPETEPTGPTMRAAQRDRGGETADTVAGRQAHSDFAATVKQKPGWKSEPSLTDPATGKTVKPDAVSRAGRPVELKPKTPSGQAAGRRQLPKYERATGKKGRVVYYPKNPNDQN